MVMFLLFCCFVVFVFFVVVVVVMVFVVFFSGVVNDLLFKYGFLKGFILDFVIFYSFDEVMGVFEIYFVSICYVYFGFYFVYYESIMIGKFFSGVILDFFGV